MMLRVLASAVVIVVGACVSTEERVAALSPSPVVAPPTVAPVPTAPAAPRASLGWARSDGRRISGDSDLTAQARADISVCEAESPPSSATASRGEACMRAKGYFVRALD